MRPLRADLPFWSRVFRPVTVGEELRQLFRDHDAHLMSEPDFRARKKQLLDWSKCQLTRALPRKLRRD